MVQEVPPDHVWELIHVGQQCTVALGVTSFQCALGMISFRCAPSAVTFSAASAGRRGGGDSGVLSAVTPGAAGDQGPTQLYGSL